MNQFQCHLKHNLTLVPETFLSGPIVTEVGTPRKDTPNHVPSEGEFFRFGLQRTDVKLRGIIVLLYM